MDNTQFETKENKIQIMIKLISQHNHMQNIRSELFCEKEKAIFKHENNMFSSHIKRLTLLWLYTRSHL